MEVAVGPNRPTRYPFLPQTDRKNRRVVRVGHLHRAAQYGHGVSVLCIRDDTEPASAMEVSDFRAKIFQAFVFGNSFRVNDA